MPILRRFVVSALAVVTVAAGAGIPAPRTAVADEIAPALEILELRQTALAEAKRLVDDLAPADRRRLAGIYVAFDANAADPSAMAACDDDGDYVVVLSDAMLRLVSIVARAQSDDESTGAHATVDYASFLAQSQLAGRRLLPPPPGFYASQMPGIAHEIRLREALSFVIARELTHLRAGDLACPHPTATHENGDDVWTAAEGRHALETAATIYGAGATRARARDEEAITRVLDVGRTELGGLGLLRFFAHFEQSRTSAPGAFAPTYLAQHPASSARVASVSAAATNHRSE